MFRRKPSRSICLNLWQVPASLFLTICLRVTTNTCFARSNHLPSGDDKYLPSVFGKCLPFQVFFLCPSSGFPSGFRLFRSQLLYTDDRRNMTMVSAQAYVPRNVQTSETEGGNIPCNP